MIVPRTVWFLSVAALLGGCGSLAAGTDVEVSAGSQEERLCAALSTIRDGERRQVVLSGIYAVGYEHAFFYDPATPSCEKDVQPETWIELAPDVVGAEELQRLLENDVTPAALKRAHVTIYGELVGPGVVGPDDLSLPQFPAFANRVRNRRYGHLNGYRTKLVVTAVRDVRSVAESVPWPSARPAPAAPVVEEAAVPRYPEMAWSASITGDVVLELTVRAGRVVGAVVKSGDRMLSDEALRNVNTWKFSPATNGAFTTTFAFRLETRSMGDPTAPRVELELPVRVAITAARNGW